MLGGGYLVERCCYWQQTASPALAWAPPAPLELVWETVKEKMALWESSRSVCSLTGLSGISGIWEAAV